MARRGYVFDQGYVIDQAFIPKRNRNLTAMSGEPEELIDGLLLRVSPAGSMQCIAAGQA